MPALRVVGRGRAGTSLVRALTPSGWDFAGFVGRDDDLERAAEGIDLLVLATPDTVVADVAGAVSPVETTVVAHLAGSLGLDALEPHRRRAAVHPLVSMPDPEIGAERLRAGAWFAVAGDPLGRRMVEDLGGRAFDVADEDRALYHAAAVIASNHLVALLAQVERLASSVGVPFEAYLTLARATLDNVTEMGPARALTGPAARGDRVTIDRHLAALAPDERPAYEVLAAEARRLAQER
jgi:predicted short-subunit dehydrogenase-like oxidoreductase (DUF2520 family)